MEVEMYVTKRDGQTQCISFDKILNRVKNLGKGALNINYTDLTMKIIDRLYDMIPTTKIDELTAQQCASLATQHYDYNILASRVVISNHQKNTDENFKTIIENLYQFRDIHNKLSPLISKNLYQIVQEHSEYIQSLFVFDRDFLIDYFGFKTLERAYLMRINGKIVERPQHMWMRVAIGIHGNNMVKVKKTYDLMSQKYFTHATPTLFNAGTPRSQCSSCFLLAMEDDSIAGIYNTLTDCAKISKWAGGIGLHVHNIRASGSHIRGTNGTSNGLVPMLRVFNGTARYVDQGGGRRNGSFAIYLEPWHADIIDFLDLKKNHGDEERRARDLFYALWIPDLFMKRVENNEKWTLMCPDQCPGLADCYGDEFEQLYEKYESEQKGIKTLDARALWFAMLDSQIETGTPYMVYKDACNKKSNQKNIGVIKSSNLCTEIIEYSDDKETAVCNLASIGLPMFVRADKTFDYQLLHEVSKTITENLNRIIDINFYPTDKTKRSNLLHRPIGIGVQGLADTFVKMDIAFDSADAREININIFETIYHGALESSCELAKERNEDLLRLKKYKKQWKFGDKTAYNGEYILDGPNDNHEEIRKIFETHEPIYAEINNLDGNLSGAYSSFCNCPASKGILQFDLWGREASDRYDWSHLKKEIQTYGLRNSLLLAPMPTASTSQILGNNECFEPFTSNIYVRRTIAGEFICVNKFLMKELQGEGLWNEDLKNSIIEHKGSVQHLNISDKLKKKYKIVWEIPMKQLIDMAADRGAFICQSQSLNLWMKDPTYKKLTAMHFYSWHSGLKTGLYYLRSRAKASPQQFTIEPKKIEHQDDEPCEMCSG